MSRPRLAAAAAVLSLVTLLSACGDDAAGTDETSAPSDGVESPAADAPSTPDAPDEPDEPASSEPTTEPAEPEPTEPEPAGPQVAIDIAGDTSSPSGERVEVPLGETVQLVVRADVAGELHVHSTPEATFEFGPGEETFELTIDRPGLVDVERHDPDQLIVQLQVQ